MFASMWEKIDGVPPVRSDALKNSCLAEWQLLQPLGKGEFAEVQACRRQNDATVYVCKHICKARLVKPSNVRHTLRRVRRVGSEITAMRLLRHNANICEILDVFHTPDFVHIVMEFGGRDLYATSQLLIAISSLLSVLLILPKIRSLPRLGARPPKAE